MLILLYCILFLCVTAVLAALIPVIFYVKVTGGYDSGFELEVRALLFKGLFGGGIRSSGREYIIDVFLRSRCFLSLDISRAAAFFTGRIKARRKKPEKPAVEKKKKTLAFYFRLGRELIRAARWVFREFHGLISVDSVLAHITLGLWRPDITGLISGFLIGLNGILPKKYEIVPSWDFTRKVIQGDMTIRFTFRGYIFWARLFTVVLPELYRQRKQIKLIIGNLRGENLFQEV